MRIFAIILFLMGTSFQTAYGETHGNVDLKHDWREERVDGEIKLISKVSAPLPFSTIGEPEATITMESHKISSDTQSLSEIIKSEIQGIREDINIAYYLEEDDHKPDHGIASYYEEFNGQKVGFIKYRTKGTIDGPEVMPRSVIHAIFIKDDHVYYINLIVLYAGHQEDMRSDQITLIKGIIGK